ncbi:hypothetical protein KQI86_16575 [Clostridium sp. MSJ-11]|uniref:Uncharacterized protein n=1 Tax=Clostridium mobile TaxID=2841512 RepID=A0ABS6ELN6_9CLOT|nr:hypothetical protein [Clostridium mobile]MBU5485938.1 hypothetical protein [Clostridium mobile]
MRTREDDVVKLLKRRKEKALDLLINDYGGLIKSIVGKHLEKEAYEVNIR